MGGRDVPARIGCAVISDRGDLYLPGCLLSLWDHVSGFERLHVVDDSHHRLGMAGAVRAAWSWALAEGFDYLFHLEEDFRFTEPLDIDELRMILEDEPQLASVTLLRQAWNEEEKAAGGIIQANPSAYTQRDGFVEHAEIFSLNPSLIPRSTLELGWPDGNEAEMTQLCRSAGLRFAFVGALDDPPRVAHVGHVRGSGWRL